ncbi:MAG: hypothetical protein M1831_002865 [Alyxoria varia]|nr:MAG: hypothetical protein M1831_002865 [Alyxoria varia]
MSTANNASGSKALEVDELLALVRPRILDFISSAGQDQFGQSFGENNKTSSNRRLLNYTEPADLARLVDVDLHDEGQGKHGLAKALESILKYSTNTWHQGFMDKLYASTNAVHVFKVSPALSVIEKKVSTALAHLFGLEYPHSGGISQAGGSAANLTAVVVARNSLFPEAKRLGLKAVPDLVLLTSAHGHYSLEKAAQVCGLGSEAVWNVPVDPAGRLDPAELEILVAKAKDQGRVPFFCNATAGTTVLGSFDPIKEIAVICKKHGIWLHVDASWGGPAIFSPALKYKLEGTEDADSVTVSPHKMMGVPIACSFLLGQDLRKFQRSNTLRAAYLFHDDDDDDDDGRSSDSSGAIDQDEVWDLADLTLQCGRKGDAMKLALAWVYYGSAGFQDRIEGAFLTAAHTAGLVENETDLVLASENPPPCLQVCFYFSPRGVLGTDEENTSRTRIVANLLLSQGFLIDFAPGSHGLFFRVVIHPETRRETLERLVSRVIRIGNGLV